jgi:penicillin-binding protein 1A
MQGGYSYARSQFNRATQAQRQPGSSFKPFVYMAALDSGYTPSSLILDAPIELPQGPGLPMWRPVNFEHDFLGPTTMRVGIEKSRNLMTVRMAATLGMDKVASYAERFGVVDHLPHYVSSALGADVTTPLRLTTAYAQIVNGGKKITPTLIDRIQDRDGKTIYRHDDRPCDGCLATFYTDQDMPQVPDTRAQLVDPMTAYQMVHILEGVVERGTGKIVSTVGKPLAGKTGTSNDSKDTWFIGFSPDLAVGVFVGFDDDTTLGRHEVGATAAAPIFRDFMAEALKDKPPTPFRIPPGIRFARIDAATGQPAQPGDKNVIMEAYKPSSSVAGGGDSVLDNSAGIAIQSEKAGDVAGVSQADQQSDEDEESQPAADAGPGTAAGNAPGPVSATGPMPLPVPMRPSPAPAPVGASLAQPVQPASPQAGGLY